MICPCVGRMSGVAGEVSRVLGVMAHPDDAEFWLGGTVACWTDAGVQVSYCVLTDGDAGGFDPAVPRDEVPRMRRAEQERAAELLRVREVRFLGLTEGQIEHSGEQVHVDLVRMIRQVRPQRVVTWSPQWNWQRFRSCHPAHLATGAAALRALYPDAGNRFALPYLLADEGLEPWTVSEAWLINSPASEVNHYVDITGTFDRKVTAVRAHASQVKDPVTLRDSLRHRIAPNTAAAGLPAGRLAEAFQVVRTG